MSWKPFKPKEPEITNEIIDESIIAGQSVHETVEQMNDQIYKMAENIFTTSPAQLTTPTQAGVTTSITTAVTRPDEVDTIEKNLRLVEDLYGEIEEGTATLEGVAWDANSGYEIGYETVTYTVRRQVT